MSRTTDKFLDSEKEIPLDNEDYETNSVELSSQNKAGKSRRGSKDKKDKSHKNTKSHA